MPTYHSIRSLRSTLALVEKREKLERQIQDINQHLHRALASQEPRKQPSGTRKAVTPAKPAKLRSGKRSRRGAMKELILSVLHEAGEAGLAVKHLAEKIGAKPANVHAWFGSTGKKGDLTEAVGRGIYRLKRSMGVTGEAGNLKAPKPRVRKS